MKKIIKRKFLENSLINRLTFSVILMVYMMFSISSCASDRKKRDPSKTTSKDSINVTTETTPIQTSNRINFYFENSGSMNGYLNGTNFIQTMHRIIDDKNPNLHPFFVNSKEYLTTNILSKIDERDIRTSGTNSSDHKFIFSNAIRNATGNNLSIVVTDGIYSTPNGDVDVVAIDIERAFESALEKNKIETVILKLTSHYKGTYYTESEECGNIGINQERPYYILLFGNKETIDNALMNIVIINDLPGFKEQARFFLTDNVKVDYTILTQGKEKKGSFRQIGRGSNKLVKEIEDAKRFSRGGEKYLQFAIAVDFSNLSIPNSYLLNSNNYKIDDETGYKIEEIKNVSNLSRSSITSKKIEKINTTYSVNLTHIIVVKAETKATGKLEIELENNFPSWINITGQDSDCSIKKNTTQTFAFDKLMKGISKAYNRVNDSDKYLELELTIKH